MAHKVTGSTGGFCGVQTGEIVHGIDDRIWTRWYPKGKWTLNKIRTDKNGKSYFVKHGEKYYLSEIMRVD